jgi:hypothetical protein
MRRFFIFENSRCYWVQVGRTLALYNLNDFTSIKPATFKLQPADVLSLSIADY